MISHCNPGTKFICSVSEISLPGPIVARGSVKNINQSDLNEVQIISEGLGLVSSEEEGDK